MRIIETLGCAKPKLTVIVQAAPNERRRKKPGKVRWLRPEFQNPASKASQQSLLNQVLLVPGFIGLQADLIPKNNLKTVQSGKREVQAWPGTLPAQVSAIAQLLASAGTALSLGEIEVSFKGKGPWKKGLPRILETLEALGRARREEIQGVEGWRAL